MALFGKNEVDNLPYLTKFFQVDAEVPVSDDDLLQSELYQFWYHEWVGHPPRQDGLAAVKTISIEGKRADLEKLAALHRLIVPVMAGLADRGRVPAGVLKQIGTQLDRLTYWRTTILFSATAEDVNKLDFLPNNSGSAEMKARYLSPLVDDYEDDYEIPMEDLRVRSTKEGDNPVIIDKVLTELLALLSCEGITAAQQVKRCADCNNPFVLQRARQKYCSERCLHRAANRRSRARKKVEAALERPEQKGFAIT